MAELSGFEVLVLVREIDLALRGTYVNNIYSIGESQLIRFRKPPGEDVWLVVSPRRGVWVSGNVSERAQTTQFTSRLRAELERAKFSRAAQGDLDRVYEIDFEKEDGRKMIVELMPPGNIIVTDASGKVLLTMREVRSAARRVLRGIEYHLPAQRRQSPLEVQPEDVSKMVRAETTVGKAIGKHVGMPRKYVAEVLQRLSLREENPSASLESRGAEVVGALQGIVNEAREDPSPCICETSTGDDIFVIPPQGLEVKVVGKSVSELCDRMFLQDIVVDAATPAPEEGKRKELEITISKLRKDVEKYSAEASDLRSAARSAAAEPIGKALQILRDWGVSSNRELTSSASVASLLFDRAKQLEEKAAEADKAVVKLTRRVPEAKEARHTKPLARRKQAWFEKFRWFVTSEGRMAVGGRDAQTNSTLISRHMENNDVAYHADLFGSPFFVLKEGAEQTETEIRQVAQATVAFSSAWKTGLGSADAYWVTPGQVSTAAPSGEYLPRGSFAIKGKKSFVTKNIVEIAMGLDSAERIMAGPEDAIKKQCARYVVLKPHREKGSDTAKRVLNDLSTMYGNSSMPITLDDVLRALPSGGGKVVRRVGGAIPTT
ncbi:MAG TPA: NFACT family protein [Nitrososphaerales archaeon]|nr:NFACT family protein [Nitrososphaerales archaeon]